jgi:hypothetical protein
MTAKPGSEPSMQRLIPPFAELFARQGGTCPAYELVTLLIAAHVWAIATQLAAVLDAQLIVVQSRIPMSHSEWGWLPWLVSNAPGDRFGRCVDGVHGLADDAAAGRCPIPRCTAEEVALHLVLEDVRDPRDRDLQTLISRACAGLPVPDGDGNWGVVATALFPNPRVRSLIADGFHGIRDNYERRRRNRRRPVGGPTLVRPLRRERFRPTVTDMRMQGAVMTRAISCGRLEVTRHRLRCFGPTGRRKLSPRPIRHPLDCDRRVTRLIGARS